MTVTTRQEPPSPPRSAHGELEFDLHHVANHNAEAEQPSNGVRSGPTGSQHTRDHSAVYQSPAPEIQPTYFEQRLVFRDGPDKAGLTEAQFLTGQYPPYAVPSGLEEPLQLDMSMGEFDTAVPETQSQGRELPSYTFYEPPPQDTLSCGSRSSVPLTPTSSDHDLDSRRMTRSGLTITNHRSAQDIPQDKPRVMRKIKKANRRGEQRRMPRVTMPLSELTKTVDAPLRDMDEWVNRTTEVRRKEVEARKGYVTRPMNSFFLYRSAYAERTKVWCLQNNHQVVSSVSGESWPLETPEIREKYNELAKLERAKHQEAHPGYKFSPSKAQAGTKKNVRVEEVESEPSDLSDPEWTNNGKRLRNRPAPSSRTQSREPVYPPNGMYGNGPADLGRVVNRSAYGFTNPGKMVPAMMDHGQHHHGQYYQTLVQHNMGRPNVEDVIVRRTDAPGMHYEHAPPMDVPGGRHYSISQHQHQHPHPHVCFHQDYQRHDSKLDPQLLAFDNGFQMDGIARQGEIMDSQGDSGFGTPYSSMGSDMDGADYMSHGQPGPNFHQAAPFNPGEQMLTDASEWPNELATHGSEFEQLMNDHANNGNQR
ncbi:MAG: hypothetical protein M1814_003037 [Vezdaea aestivalis]|nr:MAG: hypothetical protein M1814_003037 [Vezdaea aestivalis]